MRDQHLSLHLDSEQVILRSIGDEEPEPAVLSGSIVLDLHERTHINDILLVFNGRAHIAYTDTSTYKTHNFDIPIFHHDQSFLPSFTGPASVSSGSRPGSSAPSRRNSFNLNNNSSSSDAVNSSGVSPSDASGGFGTGPSSASSSSANLHASHGAASGSGSGSPSNHIHHATSTKAFHHPHSHGHGHHAHTLNAGIHRFPFAITVPGSLPASIRVAGINSSTTSYQLKVTVQKSGVFGGKWSVKRPVLLVRGLSPEAAEFNQTLEIDNTWPNKIMYNFTLPQKAYCAGETIPIALKFTPIAKGVRVTQLVTNIKEHVTVLNKNNQPHNTTRDIITKKHNFVARSTLSAHNSATGAAAGQGNGMHNIGTSTLRAHPVSVPPSRSGSHHDLTSLNQQAARLNFDDHPLLAGGAPSTSPAQSGSGAHMASSPSYPTSGTSSAGAYTPASGHSSASQSRVGSRANSPERIYYGRHTTDPEFAGLCDDDAGEEVDVDAVIEIPVPMVASPSHSLEPIMVSHKIKWSAFIKNLDGHTSELRCALPIHILSPLLVEEARLASSGTRSLLFGPSGVLVPAAEGIQQVDLPSYQDHVRDRVANIDTASMSATIAGSYGPSQQPSSSFVRSPWASPITSPEQQISDGFGNSTGSYFPGRTINWADSELLSTLALQSSADPNSSNQHSQNSSSHGSPATSRPGSRPGSRGGSRQGSRQASRASSPVRGESTNADSLSHPFDPSPAHDGERPSNMRSASSGFLSHLPKPLRPFTALGGSHHSGPPSAHLSRTSTAQVDERSHSTGSLSGFFHHHSARSAFSRHSSDHATGSSALPANGLQSGEGSDGPQPDALQAALEAAQRKQENQDKGKRRAHFSLGNNKGKGKQRGGAFSHMHETDDEDHDHDVSDDHLVQASSMHETPAIEIPVGEDDSGARILSQVPSYQVASRGFLGGGVVPISAAKGLPSYDESETLSRPGSPLTRTDTSATRSSTSTTESVNSRGSRGRASVSSLR